MFKRILVAVDGRSPISPLIQCVARLAMDDSSTVHVFHAVEFAGRGSAAPLEPFDDARDLVALAVLELKMADVDADGIWRAARRHDASWMIAEEARRWDADLIVVGTDQRRGVRRLLGRGLRERLIRRSSTPILVEPVRTWQTSSDRLVR